MKKIKKYVNIQDVDNLQDYIQSNNLIITRINKIELDVKSEKFKKKIYNKEYKYKYEYDFVSDDCFESGDLQGEIVGYFSDYLGWVIEDLNIMVKKTPQMIRDEKLKSLLN